MSEQSSQASEFEDENTIRAHNLTDIIGSQPGAIVINPNTLRVDLQNTELDVVQNVYNLYVIFYYVSLMLENGEENQQVLKNYIDDYNTILENLQSMYAYVPPVIDDVVPIDEFVPMLFTFIERISTTRDYVMKNALDGFKDIKPWKITIHRERQVPYQEPETPTFAQLLRSLLICDPAEFDRKYERLQQLATPNRARRANERDDNVDDDRNVRRREEDEEEEEEDGDNVIEVPLGNMHDGRQIRYGGAYDNLPRRHQDRKVTPYEPENLGIVLNEDVIEEGQEVVNGQIIRNYDNNEGVRGRYGMTFASEGDWTKLTVYIPPKDSPYNPNGDQLTFKIWCVPINEGNAIVHDLRGWYKREYQSSNNEAGVTKTAVYKVEYNEVVPTIKEPVAFRGRRGRGRGNPRQQRGGRGRGGNNFVNNVVRNGGEEEDSDESSDAEEYENGDSDG